ncbi:MAG: hypothetical protein ACTTG8_07400 [Catonella sp.]|uniref:hypothetical protein n=1 Tax=Catonella sp. TaxID=2382125 RepID=UPI003F9ECCE8
MVLMDYKCPNCGGAINFDTSSQRMKCPFCDTEFDMDTLKDYDNILKEDGDGEINWSAPKGKWADGEQDGLNVYVCKSCGGEIVGDDTMGATSCPYCDNPVVMSGKWEKGLRPDLVIPFKFDKKQAKLKFSEYLKGKFLLPKVFKSENHIEEIKGLYVPFWLYDADTDSRIRYDARSVRTWSDSNYSYTETSYYSVTRAGKLGFKAVPADASAKMDDVLMQSIEPYDLREAVDFQTAYLAGFLADKYDVNADEQKDIVNKRINQSVSEIFRNTVRGYSSVSVEQSTINIDNKLTRYALYPVWVLTTRWRDKAYIFAMNGQTGKFVGDLPVDKSLRTALFVGISVVTATILFLILYFVA